MSAIIIGSLYNPRQSGIPWSQPNGPGTTVYPQQQIGTPFTAYPVSGWVWAENSGIWVSGCGHWQNEPMIFQDSNGYVVTVTYLQDTSGQNWQIAVTNSGLLQTVPVAAGYGTGPSTPLLSDVLIDQTWQLGVTTGGLFTLTPLSAGIGVLQLLLAAPNSTVYGLQVADGLLQTAAPSPLLGPTLVGQLAIVTCDLCSYIQYAIPQSQFYNTFLTPTTFI